MRHLLASRADGLCLMGLDSKEESSAIGLRTNRIHVLVFLGRYRFKQCWDNETVSLREDGWIRGSIGTQRHVELYKLVLFSECFCEEVEYSFYVL